MPQGRHVHAELDALRAPGEGGHDGHDLKIRDGAHQAIGLPDRIDAAAFAEVHPAPEGAAAREGEMAVARYGINCSVNCE